MEALLVLFVIVLALSALGSAAQSFGVDSRDGFADDQLRPRYL